MRWPVILALLLSSANASAGGFRDDLSVETFGQALAVTFEVALPGVSYRLEEGLCEADEETELFTRCALTIDRLPLIVHSEGRDGTVDAIEILAYPERPRDIRTIVEVSALVARTLAPESANRVADEIIKRAEDAAISGRPTGLTASNLEWRFGRSEGESFYQSTFRAR